MTLSIKDYRLSDKEVDADIDSKFTFMVKVHQLDDGSEYTRYVCHPIDTSYPTNVRRQLLDVFDDNPVDRYEDLYEGNITNGDAWCWTAKELTDEEVQNILWDY